MIPIVYGSLALFFMSQAAFTSTLQEEKTDSVAPHAAIVSEKTISDQDVPTDAAPGFASNLFWGALRVLTLGLAGGATQTAETVSASTTACVELSPDQAQELLQSVQGLSAAQPSADSIKEDLDVLEKIVAEARKDPYKGAMVHVQLPEGMNPQQLLDFLEKQSGHTFNAATGVTESVTLAVDPEAPKKPPYAFMGKDQRPIEVNPLYTYAFMAQKRVGKRLVKHSESSVSGAGVEEFFNNHKGFTIQHLKTFDEKGKKIA